MTPELAPHQLKQAALWEYVVRFAFGGAITVATGVVAKIWGPFVAGLFLAFPAILPASLTLVKRHGGRAKAIDDARGGRLGSIGLIAFAVIVAVTADRIAAPLCLGLAAATWLAIDVGLWFATYGKSA